MNEAAAQPPPASPADPLTVQVLAELRETRKLAARAIAERGEAVELVMLSARLAEMESTILQVAMSRTMGEMEAPAPEAGPAPARHRHRRPRETAAPRRLRVVKGGGGLAALAPLRHAWETAQHATAATAASAMPAAAVAGGALAATLTLSPSPAPQAHAATAHHLVRHAAQQAVPPPFQRAAPAAPGLRKAGRHRAPASPPTPAPLPPSPTPPPPSPSPPSPSPSPSPAPSGVLEVSSQAVDLGPLRTAQVTLTAQGGPVTWAASTDSPAVTLGSGGGTLQADESTDLTVTITDPPGVGGSADIIIGPGDEVVRVTWTGVGG